MFILVHFILLIFWYTLVKYTKVFVTLLLVMGALLSHAGHLSSFSGVFLVFSNSFLFYTLHWDDSPHLYCALQILSSVPSFVFLPFEFNFWCHQTVPKQTRQP